MLRAAFSHENDGLALKLEGQLVSAWAVQVKSLVSRHFVPNGLLVVLRTTGRASTLDCILQLRLSFDTVLAANCRAMTWFAEKRTGLSDKAPTPGQKLENP